MSEEQVEQKILADIERFGCSVMHIAAEDDLPPFAFSLGTSKTTQAPEVIVVGLKQPMAHFVVNEYYRRVKEGEVFVVGQRYSGFIEGFEVLVDRVHPSQFAEYLGYCLWLHQGPNFEAVQLVYPTTRGVWPWDTSADDGFRAWQPLLRHPAEEREA